MQDGDAEAAVRIDVGVVDRGSEAEGGRDVRVVLSKGHVGLRSELLSVKVSSGLLCAGIGWVEDDSDHTFR